jgi:DNA-binding MarR family transcriptional regulator
MDTPCNCLSLRQATRRVTQLYDQVLAPTGLRSTQYSLLNRIDSLGPIALSQLAETLAMDRATLGHNLRPLEAQGLLRIAIGDDRRSRQAALTSAGRDTLARGKKLWRQAQRSFEEKIGQDTAAKLRRLLDRVTTTDYADIAE